MRVQEAIDLAKATVTNVFPESAGSVLRLEGAEKTDDERYWQVTLSYPRQEGRIEPFYREYRTIRLRSADGELMGVWNGMTSEAA